MTRTKNQWPATEIVMKPLDDLKPYERNPRTHSDAQVEMIAKAMQRFGFTNPILVDSKGGIIAGHGRLLAARKLELDEVPVVIAKGWTKAEKQAYVIADNQLALAAGWDAELLRGELADLSGLDFPLDLLGFTEIELRDLGATDGGGLTDPDDVPEPQAETIAKAGDVWLLGEHRLVCGDATDEAAVSACVGDRAPHLMVTDPPYGVEYDAAWRNEAGLSNTKRTGKVANDDRADWREAWLLFDGDVAYVWHADRFASAVQKSLEDGGLSVRSQIIWAKSKMAMSRGDYHWQHEPCWYAVRNGRSGHWSGGRKQTTLWSIHSRDDDVSTTHSTQKPVECMKRPIENNSEKGDCVYEPFCGSGTTIIAAEMTGRICLAIEIEPAYVDVSIRRWQEFTGRQAVRESDGVLFDDLDTKKEPPG